MGVEGYRPIVGSRRERGNDSLKHAVDTIKTNMQKRKEMERNVLYGYTNVFAAVLPALTAKKFQPQIIPYRQNYSVSNEPYNTNWFENTNKTDFICNSRRGTMDSIDTVEFLHESLPNPMMISRLKSLKQSKANND